MRRFDRRRLYPDDLGALLLQLCCVLLMCLLLALRWLGVMLVTSGSLQRDSTMAVAQDLAQTNKPPLDTFKGDRESTHVLETFAPVVL